METLILNEWRHLSEKLGNVVQWFSYVEIQIKRSEWGEEMHEYGMFM